jgi:hypothetical protein
MLQQRRARLHAGQGVYDGKAVMTGSAGQPHGCAQMCSTAWCPPHFCTPATAGCGVDGVKVDVQGLVAHAGRQRGVPALRMW